MAPDKYNSVWVSHSSIGDYLKCPRLYFLHNVYKNTQGRKINITSPALSLGSAVHETLEGLAKYKTEERFLKPLQETFEIEWEKISGKQGGFKNEGEEKETKERGRNMIMRVAKNPGPLQNKTVKLKDGHNGMPPNFYLSEEDNIILCGKVIDFKTGKNDESEDSLQLPIYALLLNALQRRKVSGAAYWYIDKNEKPTDVKLPDIASSKEKVLSIAKTIKEAREKNDFKCPKGANGCFACRPFEKILKNEAEFVGLGNYGQELYVV